MKRLVTLLILLILSVPAFGTDVYYSIRPAGAGSGNDLKTACNISISSGIATFSAAQTGDIGVGCYVSSSNVSGYISEMTDSTHAKIITATGGVHGDVSSEALGAIYHPFASLSTAESGSPTLLGYATDLATNTIHLYWPSYGATPDTSMSSVSGWTFSDTYYAKWYAVRGGTESINNWRHTGKRGTNNYRVLLTNGDTEFNNIEPFFHMEGIQVDVDLTSSASFVGLSFPYGGYIDSCIISNIGEANTSRGLYSTNANDAYDWVIINCIVSGWSGANAAGVRCSSTNVSVYLYNCTIMNCTIGVYNYSSTLFDIADCAIFNNGDDFLSSFDSVIYTASDDNDITGTGNFQIGTYSDIFTDYSNGDFSLKNFTGTGALIDAGTTISEVTTDIIGTSRPQGTTYDIGAFEYVSSGGSSTIPAIMHHYRMLRSQ